MPSGRRITDVPECQLDSLLQRRKSLRLSGEDMSQYRVRKRIIRKEWRPDEGRIRRTSCGHEDECLTIAELEAPKQTIALPALS